MTTTMLASGSLCVPQQPAHNLSPLSFSKSCLLSPRILESRAVSTHSGCEAFSLSTTLSSFALSSYSHVPRIGSSRRVVKCKSTEERTPPTAESNFMVKLAWYGSEAFGKVVSGFRPKKSDNQTEELEETFEGPVERKDAVELIRADLDRSYFVTGNMATGIYEADCEFADPFVSFKGLKRFKQNVGNLGSFMEESSLKLLDWQEFEDRIYAKWRFNCVLALPWRPILAASGSTEYFFRNDSGKIFKHVETWDISPLDGLRQLIRPNPRKKSSS